MGVKSADSALTVRKFIVCKACKSACVGSDSAYCCLFLLTVVLNRSNIRVVRSSIVYSTYLIGVIIRWPHANNY